MPRGITPRQPAKTGRHEGTRKAASKKPGVLRTPRTGEGARPHTVRGAAPPPRPEAKPTIPRLPTAFRRFCSGSTLSIPTSPAPCTTKAHGSCWSRPSSPRSPPTCGVNLVTPEIFKKYPTVQDFAALEPEQLQPDVHSTGFFRNKSKSVVGAAKKIVSDFGGQVPDQMDQLLTLPGVARKTANVVLGTWFKKNEGVVVDTHVHRISRRLELTRNDDPKKIEQDLMQIIPREKWTLFSHQIIWHGRKLCIARRPKCADCPLENICHAADKTWSTVEIHKNATSSGICHPERS